MGAERDSELEFLSETHQSEIPRSGKTNLSFPTTFTFRLFIRDIPDLDQLVHSSCGYTSSNMGVDVECGCCAVVGG